MKHLKIVAGRRLASSSLAFGLAVCLANPTLADSLTETLYNDAPRWWVDRIIDPNTGALQVCSLYMSSEKGRVLLTQEDATKEMTLRWLPSKTELDEVREVLLGDYFAKAIIDGNEVLEIPRESDSAFPALAKSEEREALLTAIADGSRMTFQFVAGISAADIDFTLKGSGKAVAAYRQCLSGDSVAGETSTEQRDFPVPVGWTIDGVKNSEPAAAELSTCNVVIYTEGALFQIFLTVAASGNRILIVSAGQGPWVEPVLSLASSVKVTLSPSEIETGGRLFFVKGQDSAFEIFLRELAKDGTLVFYDAKGSFHFEMRVEGAAMGVASLRDCMAFIAK